MVTSYTGPVISDIHSITVTPSVFDELHQESNEKKQLKAEKKTFKAEHPEGLGVSSEDSRRKEAAKHNRKNQKLAKRLKVALFTLTYLHL